MAITATITVAPSAVQINQTIKATLAVANSGASAVTVKSITPYAVYTGATPPMPASVAYGTPNLSAGATVSVPASGSVDFPLDLVFFAPSTGLYGTGSGTYDVTAFVTTDDGSFTTPAAAATVTVDQIEFPS